MVGGLRKSDVSRRQTLTTCQPVIHHRLGQAVFGWVHSGLEDQNLRQPESPRRMLCKYTLKKSFASKDLRDLIRTQHGS